MFSPTVRFVAFFVMGVATLALAFAAVLFQAASVTGADSNYSISVTWGSALASVIWPPGRIPIVLLLLIGVAIVSGFTALAAAILAVLR
jgi:hypothetical protein